MTSTEKDRTITVTKLDYSRLTKLIKTFGENKIVDIAYLKLLDKELQMAVKMDSKLITPDFVTMDSLMNIIFLDTGKMMELRLVYPHKADFTKGLISVLSPLGCALLGYKAGDIISFNAPKGEHRVKIEKVIYQPEAHGEDLL